MLLSKYNSVLVNAIKVFFFFFLSVQFSCSVVSDSATPWTAAHQASLSLTNSWSLLKLMSLNSLNRWALHRKYQMCIHSFTQPIFRVLVHSGYYNRQNYCPSGAYILVKETDNKHTRVYEICLEIISAKKNISRARR